MGFGFDSSGIPTNLRLRCYKSTNAGKTWRLDSTPSGKQTNVDKELMWVDHSRSSPFADSMYVIWQNDSRAFVSRRTSIGGPWSAPIQVSGAETTGTAQGADIKTNSFGDGVTWSAAVKVTTAQTVAPTVLINMVTTSGCLAIVVFFSRRGLTGGAVEGKRSGRPRFDYL